MSADPDGVEIRVLGALLEKQRTTPEAYPLSLNALRVACNQSTNRDPVVAYEDQDVLAALERLHRRGWTRMASGAGSRARKYRQLVDRALGLEAPALAVLGVLMLRGPQTPGELKQRAERWHPFTDLSAVEAVLEALIDRGMAGRLDRRPGQKEQRYQQRLGGAEEGAAGTASPQTPDPGPQGQPGEEDRLARLEQELSELRAEVAVLLERLGS